MKNLAAYYYQKGYGCSECILKAAESKYNLSLGSAPYKMAGTLNAGFGIGGMCAVVISSVMVLGLLFDERTAKSCRIDFLTQFQDRYDSVNCGKLVSMRKDRRKCEDLICGAAEILENIIIKTKR